MKVLREGVANLRAREKLDDSDRQELEGTINDLRYQIGNLTEGYSRMATEYRMEKRKWEDWRSVEKSRGFFGHLYQAFATLVR